MLTDTQSKVLDFIALHIVQMQRPPTRKDISARFGWASANAATEHLMALERKRFIVLDHSGTGEQYGRYARVLRWPDSVAPVLQLADES